MISTNELYDLHRMDGQPVSPDGGELQDAAVMDHYRSQELWWQAVAGASDNGAWSTGEGAGASDREIPPFG